MIRYTYDTHSRCRRCGIWVDGKDTKRCPECNYRLSHKTRISKLKDPDRWDKAY